MPTRKPRRARQRAPRRKTRQRTAIAKSLLILECDTAKLARQALSMADEIAASTTPFAPGALVTVTKSHTEQDLLQTFSRLAETNSRFRVVVVVGHSNEFGLQLASDRHVSWSALAKWLEPFEPRQIVLVACKAEQMGPAQSLFDGIPTLCDLYASPIVTTKQHVQAIRALVPYLLNVKLPDPELIMLGQLVNFLITRGAIFRWRRADFPLAGTRASRSHSRRAACTGGALR